MAEVNSKMGGIDCIFANAGIEGSVKTIVDYDMEEYDNSMNVNVRGVFLTLKYGMPELKKRGGGAVVISSSVSRMKCTAGVSVYTTSKHALVGLMPNAAPGGAPDGIRVNCIIPAPVDNRMMRSLKKGFAPDSAADAEKQFEQTIPLGRYAKPSEVADQVHFLCSDERSYISGAMHPIDRAMTV